MINSNGLKGLIRFCLISAALSLIALIIIVALSDGTSGVIYVIGYTLGCAFGLFIIGLLFLLGLRQWKRLIKSFKHYQ